jgi:general secretion pathway protein K
MSNTTEDRGDAGFALLSVIGAIGIIAAIMTAFIASARYRAIEAFSVSQRARAETMSDAAGNATILRILGLLARGGFEADRLGLASLSASCVSGDGSSLRVAVMHESGKVDLNTARAELVAALLKGVVGEGRHQAILHELVRLRESGTAPTHRTVFESALQIGQVPGIDDRLAERLLPLVTVHSGSPGLHARLASADVLSAVSGQSDPALAQRRNAAFFLADVPGPSVQITAEAWTSLGVRFARSAIVEFLPERPASYRIREWREGSPSPGPPPARNRPSC